MAGQSGYSYGLNPYSGLESLDTKQAPSPASSNLIDLSRTSSRSPTIAPQPSLGRNLTSTNSGPANGLNNTVSASSNALLGDTTSSRHGDLSKYRCGLCSRKGRDRSYCDVCRVTYCQGCWNKQILHSSRSNDVHERTDVRIYEILRASLRPKRSESEQKELHKKDESTTWFGVAREGGIEESTFKDHGRFWKMMKELSKGGSRNIYPGLVSFVGHTGAGKSTIVKILIELRYRGEEEPETPVVGSLEARNCPTSGDVHLYSDPHTAEQDYPILYADCEGLEGGEMLPTGTNLNEAYGTRGHINTRRAFHGSERRITWATTAERQTRQFAVANLYPRFLYTFSDVVVFVLKNGREFENVAKSLLRWAAAALEKSSNQPVLPHAILALNESPNELPDWHWNSDFATRMLLNEYRNIIHNNPSFEPYVEFWRRSGKRIDSLEALLRRYYSSITVVNIPSKGRPNLISQQIETLYEQIKLCCKKSRAAKQPIRMLFTADELHPYLVSAFDHFATNLDEPFDFVKFSFTNSPIPMDFAGSIVKLAVTATNSRRRNVSVYDIFEELSYMVASSIMLDAARHRKIGTAEAIFLNYLGHCDDALEDFCDRFWPCEFRNGNGACINVKAGHNTTKGHQRRDGRVIGKGNYQSDFSTDRFRPKFRDMIFNNLQQLLEKLGQKHDPESLITEAQDAASIHLELILKPFFEHLDGAKSFQSNSICFCCLMALPEHPLPCGHVLCTSCVRSYGSARRKYVIEMTSCPLELNGEYFEVPCQIILKPATAGVRILSLDGGGIRAVAELEVLRILKKELGGQIPLRAFFDLIVGTNTGGMIALDLAMIDENGSKDVGTVINNFTRFCETSFTHANMLSSVPFISKPRYHTGPLENALKRSYANDHLFGWSKKRADLQPKVSVVCSLNNSSSIILSNYNRPNLENGTYIFQRPDSATEELKVWEAARATVTIPTIFRDFRHLSSNRVYHGGNFEYNNPVEVADLERKLIWPDTEDSHPDILISIGAGYDLSIKKPSRWSNNWRSKSKSDDRVLLDPVQSSLDAQNTWDHYYDSLLANPRDESRYVRLNPPVDCAVPKLDDVDEMAAYKKEIRKVLRSLTLTDYAQQLIGSCFFFDILQPPTEGENRTLVCKGSIECRFADLNIRHLGEYFNEIRKGNNLYFSVQERGSQINAMKHPLTGNLITKMIEERRFKLGLIDVTVSQRISIVEIALHFSEDRSFPISGFPRHLQQNEIKRLAMRLQRSRPSRWRPENREAHREEWTGPSTTESARPTTNLSQYASPGYVCGKTKLPFARSELHDQPVQLPAKKCAEELDSGASLPPRIRENRSSLPVPSSTKGQGHIIYTEASQARSDPIKNRGRQRRTDPGLEALSSTAAKLHTPSRTRNDSNDNQTTAGQFKIATSSGQRVSRTSKTQSTSNLNREAHQRQWDRAPLVPEAADSSENEATATTVIPKSATDGTLSLELHIPTFGSGNADSDLRPGPSKSGSGSTQQQRARQPSSEHRNREISEISRPSTARTSLNPWGQSSGNRCTGEGSEGEALSSSQKYPPVTERRRRRHRSSRSSERRRI